MFCGDAIADPLTGLEAALAVAESLGRGGGELIHVSMAARRRDLCGAARPRRRSRSTRRRHRRHRRHAGPAPELGADNDAVRRLVAERRCLSC